MAQNKISRRATMANDKKGSTEVDGKAVNSTEVSSPTEVTEESLIAKIKEMVNAGNFGSEFTKLSKQLAGIQANKEKAELEAKVKALAELTEKIKNVIIKATEPFLKEIEARGGDGIWFVSDWGEALVETRLIKKRPSAPRRAGSGKKIGISTAELLEKHGNEIAEDGMTYQDKYNSNTNSNARYQIRLKLLKLENLI